MNEQEILSNLCVYDPRHPDHALFYIDYLDTEPRKKCYCDNCFYGRDKLALEIIRLKEVASLSEVVYL